jgi:demethylmenaquinone methyltransferase/2-methoxy-6-polyprenyl-1,4-benzoquinol methylase
MKTTDDAMKTYYRERVPVYDQVYAYPERQSDLRFLENHIPGLFTGLDVLEIAAGTGYWTQFIVTRAKSVLATDATAEALLQLEQRSLSKPVATRVVDAYELDPVAGQFSGLFAGMWLSHVPKQLLRSFLASLHRLLQPSATLVYIDNSMAQCQRLPIVHTDESGNTFQDRRLADDTVHRVLKNFPTEEELVEATLHLGVNHQYMALENYWLFRYQAH